MYKPTLSSLPFAAALSAALYFTVTVANCLKAALPVRVKIWDPNDLPEGAPAGAVADVRAVYVTVTSAVCAESGADRVTSPPAKVRVPPEAGIVSANTLLAVANRRENTRVRVSSDRMAMLCREVFALRNASLLNLFFVDSFAIFNAKQATNIRYYQNTVGTIA